MNNTKNKAGTNPVRDQVNELLGILDAERVALLSGDYDVVTQGAEAKDRLRASLEAASQAADAASAGLSESEINRLRTAIERNEALLQAAQNGVRLAQLRKTQIARKSSEVGVYNPTGERPHFTDALANPGRRA